MFKTVLLFAAILLSAPAFADTPVSPTAATASTPEAVPVPSCVDHSLDNYQLVWHDEFNDNKLDTTEWDYRLGPRLLSVNKAENVSEGDGVLRLALKKEQVGKLAYSSAGIISKRTFKYGYYEARFKCPSGEGWHTSFWTYYVPTPTLLHSDEIDICEQDSVHHGVYSSGEIDWSRNERGFGRVYYNVPVDLSAGYHTWGCEFTPTTITYYFDGAPTGTTDATQFPTSDAKIYLTSVAVLWHGSTKVDEAALPEYALYDWVRFYQKAGDLTNGPSGK